MNRHLRILLGLLLISCSSVIQANGYFNGNPYSPYPPGCITVPARQIDLYGDNVALFWSGSMQLEVVHKLRTTGYFGNLGLVHINMYRVSCAEPNRSIIMAEFTLPQEWDDPRHTQIVLPSAVGDLGMGYIPFEFRAEPNSWGQNFEQQAITKQAIGDYTGGWDDPRHFTWRYVLDVGSEDLYWGPEFLTDYYNSRFFLELVGNYFFPFDKIGFEVPATDDLLAPNTALPFNGRLSGIWIEKGATDQGLLLSFSNPVPPAGTVVAEPANAPLLVFFSWFTFDAQGDPLWLSGSASFPQGAAEATLPIVKVIQGQFLGSLEAERRIVGSLQLSARQCNAIEVHYDLADLELGKGDLRLQRLEALEIAGYPCRDFTARRTSLSSNPGN